MGLMPGGAQCLAFLDWGSLCLPGVISYFGYCYATLPAASVLAALGKNQKAQLV